MIVIQDVLVSEDVVKKAFVCNLNACKGACCWEGDYGAPVTDDEKQIILDNLDNIKSYLPQKSLDLLDQEGAFAEYSETAFTGTTLHPDGACVFLAYESDGSARCGIEKAHQDGMVDYKKPLSCHMYPIRVSKNEEVNFEAWNYDEWDICQAACALGEKLQVPVYTFLKDSIIRAKGEAFYEELDAAAQYVNNE